MAKVGFYNDNQYRDYPFIHQSRTGAFYELAQDAIVDVGFTLGPSVIYDPQKDSILLRSVAGAGGVLRYSFELFRSDITNRAGDKPLDHTATAGIKLTFEVPAGTLPFTTIHDSVEIEIGDNVIDNLTFEYNPDQPIACTFNDTFAAVETFTHTVATGFLTIGDPTKIIDDVYRRGGFIDLETYYVVEPARIQSAYKHVLNSIRVGNMPRVVVPECYDSPQPEEPEEGETDTTPKPVFPRNSLFNGNIKFVPGVNLRLAQNKTTNTINFTPVLGEGVDSRDTDLCDYRGELPFTELEAFVFTENIDNKNLPFAWKKAFTETVTAQPETGGPFPPATPEDERIEKVQETLMKAYGVTIYTDATGEEVKSKYISGGKTCAEGIYSINGLSGSNVTIIAGPNVDITTGEEENEIIVRRLASAAGGCS